MSVSDAIKKTLVPWLAKHKRIPKERKGRLEYYWRPWHFPTKSSADRLIYISGDSWMTAGYFNNFIMETWPDDFIINRAKAATGNRDIINILKRDIDVLKDISLPKTLLIVFSEVGRNINEIDRSKLDQFTTINDYLKTVQKKQCEEIYDIGSVLDNCQIFVTTAYVPNSFNGNPSIIDFLDNHGHMPTECYNLTSKFYAWFVEQNLKKPEQLMSDLDNLDSYSSWLLGHKDIDHSVHIVGNESYVYQKFFKHYLNNEKF